MDRSMNKVVLVTRETRLQELIRKYNTMEQARFYMEHLGADFSDYLREDKNYREAVEKVAAAAEKYARVQRINRDFLPNMLFGEKDIVVAVGQDGLVANDEIFKRTAADRYQSRSRQVGRHIALL